MISVDTRGYGGKSLAKSIQILSNDPEISKTRLKVRGKVDKIADISLKVVHLEGSPDDELNKVVTIVPSDKYKFKILSFKVQNGDNIEAVLKEKVPADDTGSHPGWDLHIKNKRKTPGRYYESIHLTTDFNVSPKLTIRVFGNISYIDDTSKDKEHGSE